MCNGSGEYFAEVTEQHGFFARVVGRAPTGLPCPACNGHGKDPSPPPHCGPLCPFSGCANCAYASGVGPTNTPQPAEESA